MGRRCWMPIFNCRTKGPDAVNDIYRKRHDEARNGDAAHNRAYSRDRKGGRAVDFAVRTTSEKPSARAARRRPRGCDIAAARHRAAPWRSSAHARGCADTGGSCTGNGIDCLQRRRLAAAARRLPSRQPPRARAERGGLAALSRRSRAGRHAAAARAGRGGRGGALPAGGGRLSPCTLRRHWLRLSSRAAALIPAAVAEALALNADDIGFAATALAIGSALHETQYSRLFRS